MKLRLLLLSIQKGNVFAQIAIFLRIAFSVICLGVSQVGISQTAVVDISNPAVAQTQDPPIQNGERLSEWMLKERQIQNTKSQINYTATPYYLGTSWLTPKEVGAQEEEKAKLLAALQKINFPQDVAGQNTKQAFTKLISAMQATGRVVLPNTNPRYLEVNPKINPILESNERVIVPELPNTITVIRSNASLCKIRYRPNIEARFYVQGCKLKGKNEERSADWAWVIEPDGSVHQVSLAAWNSAKQDLPAPGSWIWAPPHWSIWSGKDGEAFSNELAKMLSAQGPSGLEKSIDDGNASRANLPLADKEALYSVSRDLPISSNMWGETGLLQTPTARTAPAGTGAVSLGLFQPYGIVNLFFAPVNGMEFIMRYTNINNIPYGEQSLSGGQTYKDKSTGLKVRLLNENAYLPEVAVGVRDVLGTGLFSGEYFVANKRHNDFDFSLGMGWGQLGTRNNVTNPFVTAFGQNYATRPAATTNQGGTSTGGFFHGTAALFGGLQYHTPWDKIVLKAEVDGNNYQQLPFSYTMPAKTIYNFGATYQMKNADFTVAMRSNYQVMFVLSLHERLDLLNTPKLAEAKVVPVDLKAVGSYTPSNPSLNIFNQATINKSGASATDARSPVITANPKTDNKNIVSSQAAQVTTPSTNIAANPIANEQATSKVTAPSPSSVNAYQGFLKQNITTQYNDTLIDFEKQSQWQVKGLQGTGKTWTVHLLDASGVFIRSRVNRGVAVLHRDAPSQIETFQIQFYNWGMLVSEFTVDRQQWMLSQTQLLPPSQARPPITVFNTATLPADGGNPFFEKTTTSKITSPLDASGNSPGFFVSMWGSSKSSNQLDQTNQASQTSQTAAEEPIMIDELGHKALQTNVGVSYAQIVGSPSSPFLFALGIKGDALYKFRENTWVTGTVNARVVDNFGKYNYDPPPTGLQPVRTNIRQYMTQSLVTMPNLQATNTGKLADNHFVSAYAGYLESMFAGAGGEYLWRPTSSKIAVGADINRVRQRQFNMWTSMQNYAVTTGHVTAYWDTGVQDILVKLSGGKYLAGDIGGTLDLSRVFQNGVKVGAYATRTNVNYAQFGEGSFDKGVYISVPFDAFFARHSDSSANLLFTPLIRDGGAMLMRKYRLYDMTRTRDDRALTAGPD